MRRVQEKIQGPEERKLTEVIVCYRDEYAIICYKHLAEKTKASLNQSLLFWFKRNCDILDLR